MILVPGTFILKGLVLEAKETRDWVTKCHCFCESVVENKRD